MTCRCLDLGFSIRPSINTVCGFGMLGSPNHATKSRCTFPAYRPLLPKDDSLTRSAGQESRLPPVDVSAVSMSASAAFAKDCASTAEMCPQAHRDSSRRTSLDVIFPDTSALSTKVWRFALARCCRPPGRNGRSDGAAIANVAVFQPHSQLMHLSPKKHEYDTYHDEHPYQHRYERH